MDRTERALVTITRAGASRPAAQLDEPTVVWLRGEHDLSNAPQVQAAIDCVLALDDGEVVVDLSGVDFLGGATVGVLLRTRRSRPVAVRHPSRAAHRILDVCGFAALLGGTTADPGAAAPPS